jgi:hypothetical protein
MTLTAKKARLTGQIAARPARLSSVILGAEPATGDATADQVLTGATFSNATENGVAGTMPNIGKEDFTPSTANQAISEGYHNGSGSVAGDADLVAGNIKKDVDIFGVIGSFEGDTSGIKADLDAANEEASADVDAAVALVESNYAAIKAAIEAKDVDMTGVIPSGYDAKITEIGNLLAFTFNPANGVLMRYNMANGGKDVVIPAEIGGVAVTRIFAQAFYSNYFEEGGPFLIDSVYMPDSIAACDTQIFFIAGVKSIRISENPAFTTIPQQFCTHFLPEVVIPPQITTIAAIAFQAAPLIKITIPGSVTITDDGSMGTYGAAFRTLYNGNGKLAGTYTYAAGTWTKTA